MGSQWPRAVLRRRGAEHGGDIADIGSLAARCAHTMKRLKPTLQIGGYMRCGCPLGPALALSLTNLRVLCRRAPTLGFRDHWIDRLKE